MRAAWLVWGQFQGQDRLEENLTSVPGGLQTRPEGGALLRCAVRPLQDLTPPLAVSAQVLEVQQQQPKQQPRQPNLVSQPGETLRLPTSPGVALTGAGDAGHGHPGLAHDPT